MYGFSHANYRYDHSFMGSSNFHRVDDCCRCSFAYGQDSASIRWWLSKRFRNTKRGKLALATISKQSNLVENLPLYIGVVFLLTVRGVFGTAVDALVIVYIVFRLVHSAIHIAGINPMFRLLSLVIQLVCLVALTALAIF